MSSTAISKYRIYKSASLIHNSLTHILPFLLLLKPCFHALTTTTTAGATDATALDGYN